MKKSKLWEHYSGLSSLEIRQFRQFLASPYFNRDKVVIQLFEALHTNASRIKDDKTDRSFFYKKLFPKDKNQLDWKLNEKVSNLLKLYRQFYIQQTIKQDSKKQAEILTESYRYRKMDKYFFKSIEDQLKKLDAGKIRDESYYLEKMTLNQKLYYHANTSKTLGRKNFELLTDIHESLDQYYILSKLKQYCEVVVRRYSYGETYSINLIDEIKKFLKNQRENKSRYISQLYYDMLNLVGKSDLNKFLETKKKVLNNLESISEKNKFFQVTFLTLILRASFKPEIYIKEIYSVLRFGLENNLFIEDGYISVDLFNNIVDCGCALKKFDETKQFIQEYVSYLPNSENVKSNLPNLYNAYLYMGQSEYKIAISLLKNLDFEDYTFGLRKNVLHIKCLFEISGSDAIDKIFKQSESYKVYLYRKMVSNQISKQVQEANNKFLFFIKKISNFRFEAIEKNELYKELEQEANVAAKAWLKEKVMALK